jgi:lariat debranching enzyme
MFFMGYSGVVNFGGLRIGGLSGIFDKRNYTYGHFEFPPYDRSTVRSVYHVREYEVRKLLQVKGKLDIFLSHDWPRGVANCRHCDRFNLFKLKPFFKDEIMRDELGSPAAAQLCNRLRPSYWFSAHLHVKFPALIHHSKSVSEHTVTARRGEVEGVGQQGDYTKFLALDKCLPRREYLQILDFPDTESPKEFQYDVEWLAILKKLHAEMPMDRRQVSCQTDASSCQGSCSFVLELEIVSFVCICITSGSFLRLIQSYLHKFPLVFIPIYIDMRWIQV